MQVVLMLILVMVIVVGVVLVVLVVIGMLILVIVVKNSLVQSLDPLPEPGALGSTISRLPLTSHQHHTCHHDCIVIINTVTSTVSVHCREEILSLGQYFPIQSLGSSELHPYSAMKIYNVKINNSRILNNDENASKIIIKSSSSSIDDIQGVFLTGTPLKS